MKRKKNLKRGVKKKKEAGIVRISGETEWIDRKSDRTRSQSYSFFFACSTSGVDCTKEKKGERDESKLLVTNIFEVLMELVLLLLLSLSSLILLL